MCVLSGHGRGESRAYHRQYFPEVNGIVYLIDAKDPERLAEAKEALDELLGLEALQRVPFLLLGNKIDHPVSSFANIYMHALIVSRMRFPKTVC